MAKVMSWLVAADYYSVVLREVQARRTWLPGWRYSLHARCLVLADHLSSFETMENVDDTWQVVCPGGKLVTVHKATRCLSRHQTWLVVRSILGGYCIMGRHVCLTNDVDHMIQILSPGGE